jgi:hypothetical protein
MRALNALINHDEALELAEYHRRAIKSELVRKDKALLDHHRTRCRYFFEKALMMGMPPEMPSEDEVGKDLHVYRGTETGLERIDQPSTAGGAA